MSVDAKNKAFEHGEQNANAANTGNASNPSPGKDEMAPASNQLLDEKAEKYLRESGNIEDMPDAEEQENIDRVIRENK